jgi:ATP-binding cassette subfamily B protein RaxB
VSKVKDKRFAVEQIDMARVRECADLAQIKTDIERMPMGYESLVGGMGSKPPWP